MSSFQSDLELGNQKKEAWSCLWPEGLSELTYSQLRHNSSNAVLLMFHSLEIFVLWRSTMLVSCGELNALKINSSHFLIHCVCVTFDEIMFYTLLLFIQMFMHEVKPKSQKQCVSLFQLCKQTLKSKFPPIICKERTKIPFPISWVRELQIFPLKLNCK